MAPQESIPPAANVLGTIGTAVGVSRIWHNWRRKSTEGLPGLMLMLWATCAVPFGVYAIVQNFNFPLQLQPQCFGFLTLICWGQTLVYQNKWRTWTATLVTGLIAAGCGVIELVLVLALRGPYSRGVEWPLTMLAIIAAVILAVGLIPPYFELAKRNGRVIGINFIFLTVDYAGAFFSLMALVAQNTFDYLGGCMYIVCMFLEAGIFLSQFIWLYRTRHIRKAARKSGKTYDEYMAETSPSSPTESESHPSHGKDDESGSEKEHPGNVGFSDSAPSVAELPRCLIRSSNDSGSFRPAVTGEVDLEKGEGGGLRRSQSGEDETQ